jgi:hypothetical protein
MMQPSLRARGASRSFVALASLGLVAVLAACSDQSAAPRTAADPSFTLAAVTSTQFTLSSITPPVECTDAAGAVTTVTGGTLSLSSGGKYSAAFATSTTSSGVVTTKTYVENGTFTQKGSTLTFKVAGAGTFSGTLNNGVLTVANYPYCGATHTLIYTQS